MKTPKLKHPKITCLTATIGGKRYRVLPASSCAGCAFEADCYAVPRKAACPTFGGQQFSLRLNAIFKEMP